MRFAAVAALFGVAVMATPNGDMSTVYETSVETVTSCPVEVSECTSGQSSTAVETSMVPIAPPVDTTDVVVSPTPAPSFTSLYQNTTVPDSVCPETSIRTIATHITTVIPTVIFETVEIPCPTETSVTQASGVPSGSIAPPAVTGPVVTDGAASLGVSGLTAVVAAAAAGLFALVA